jgi:hypothetical protein
VLDKGRGISTIAMVAVVVGGCASDPAPVTTARPASPCVLEQRPVVLADGSELYIEPQTLFRAGADWWVVGSPSYQFDVAPGRDWVNLSRFEHVGVALSSPARAIEEAVPGTTGSMISTPLGDGRWAAVFDLVDPDSLSARRISLSYWYGEHDGTRWSLIEPLPVPPGTNLDLRQSSNLVRVGDRLIWIAWDDEMRWQALHRYERIGGTWRHEHLPDQNVELVVLATDEASELWILFAGHDPDLPGWQKTIRLYRDGPPRELVSRVVAVPDADALIYHPALEVGRGHATVSWALFTPAADRAFTRTGIAPGAPGTVIELDDNVEYVHSTMMPDGSLTWVVEHIDPETRREELRVLRLDGSRVVRVATAPSPFTGFFRIRSAGPNEVLLVGAQMGRESPETPVRSLILRLSTSC